jgi:hypothetical protein
MVLKTDCELVSLSMEQFIIGFDCGDADLNEFFNQDAIKYQDQLLGNTYFFRHNETGKIICAFSLSPDGLNTSNQILLFYPPTTILPFPVGRCLQSI